MCVVTVCPDSRPVVGDETNRETEWGYEWA